MSLPQEQADQELVGKKDDSMVEGIDQLLTPLQYHYLSLLPRLIAVKNSYQTDANFEAWLMAAINKAIYSTLRDCIESNIGDAAKELLRREHQVN
jgi:hypothetical protein